VTMPIPAPSVVAAPSAAPTVAPKPSATHFVPEEL
jgi:hypothetical protein